MEIKNIKNCLVIAWFLATIDIIFTMAGISNFGIDYEINYFPKYVYSNIGIWYGSLIIFAIELLTFICFYYVCKYLIKYKMKSKILVKPSIISLLVLYSITNMIHLTWYI